jgi:hypothetical protein
MPIGGQRPISSVCFSICNYSKGTGPRQGGNKKTLPEGALKYEVKSGTAVCITRCIVCHHLLVSYSFVSASIIENPSKKAFFEMAHQLL